MSFTDSYVDISNKVMGMPSTPAVLECPRQNSPSYLMTNSIYKWKCLMLIFEIKVRWLLKVILDNKQRRRITFQRRERNKMSPSMSLAYFLKRDSRPESNRVWWPRWMEEMEFGVQGGWDLHDKILKSRKLSRQRALNISSLGRSLALCPCGRKLLKVRKEQARSSQPVCLQSWEKVMVPSTSVVTWSSGQKS